MKQTLVSIPAPDLQVDFSLALQKMRGQFMQEALSNTVAQVDISALDKELSGFVTPQDLSGLASRGLRAELVFPVPCVLTSNPRLIAYYRLLLGFSQKAFYSAEWGTSSFKSMEEEGRLTAENSRRLSALCHGMASAASILLAWIGIQRVSKQLLDDLTLLTLGPQLRGGANVRKGTIGIEAVFEAIQRIVRASCLSVTAQRIELRNAAKRRVFIEFASDPDIIIRELMASETCRNVIAIEIKGGTDFSNIHNRLGEAEKSHQKARQKGFVECWTIVNVDRIDLDMARRESPATNRFYRLSQILLGKVSEFADFRNRIISLTGIPGR